MIIGCYSMDLYCDHGNIEPEMYKGPPVHSSAMPSVQERIIQHIADDRNPMFRGLSFEYMRDWYRAAISNLGFTRQQAEAAVQDAVDMAAF